MANTKVDLTKIHEEIASRKREKTDSIVNETGTGVIPRDVFLNELLTSLQSGRKSPVINNIKTMDARAEIINNSLKTGVVTQDAVNKINELKQSNTQVIPQARPINRNPDIDMSPEREEQLFRDFENRKKQTLAESIQTYVNTPAVGAPMNNNPVMPPKQLNENYLNENVKKMVDNYLFESTIPVLEEAIKSTVMEMYAVERIREVLQENREMIKSIVKEVIKEIQEKNKAKSQNLK